MGLIQRLFGREEQPAEVHEPPRQCTHATLVPRWDNPDDIGKEDRASAWTCASCEASFTPQEKRALDESEAARIADLQKAAESKPADE